MLSCLRVENLAIIDRIEVDLGAGLNVVTGETGAGKSILIAALQLVLGARARPELVRSGCEQAEVEALFTLSSGDPVLGVLRGFDFEPDGEELVLRRIVKSSGRSRATVNGRLATLAQLRQIAAHLVDISSQHEHTTLVDPATHLGYLDAFGGHDEARRRVAQAHRVAREAQGAVRELRERLEQRSEREDLLRFRLAELDRVDPRPGEVEALRVERDRLRHGERLLRAAASAAGVIDGDEGGVCDRLGKAVGVLADAGRHDASLSELGDRLDSAVTELRDIAHELSLYVHDLDLDPERLAHVEDRSQALDRLLRRFGGDESALHAFRDQAHTELGAFEALEDDLRAAAGRVEAALNDAERVARELSQARSAVAGELAVAITQELADLGMGDARVEVAVAPLHAAEDALQVGGGRLTESGIDRVEFLIAPNPGEAPRPLARVASGGELSRALLALKRVLSGLGPAGLYVFDEVDTGVGGAIAEAIGRKICEVAAHHQVLCITHQPQIAAFGHTHLHVTKQVHQGRTKSRVVRLSDEERARELARMLGGAVLTEATHRAAADLLTQARERAP
ncbi:MAG: DNA repair protein RecN [Deltaproteobacteria bacterium]|nr:MAG: DNA repair protein RecN [Deltaproteobacteria bacterium]